jgi:hypothetical protein
MKTCTKCKMEKELFEFSKKAGGKDGLQRQCKQCAASYLKKYYFENKEKVDAINLAWRSANPGKVAATRRKWICDNQEKTIESRNKWLKANPEKRLAARKKWNDENAARRHVSGKKWSVRNPEKVSANTARRRAKKLNANPNWAIDFLIEEAYDLAQKRTVSTGFAWHLDHIVPLNSNLVCGLHSHTNIRVIPGIENHSKSNKYWPDMP